MGFFVSRAEFTALTRRVAALEAAPTPVPPATPTPDPPAPTPTPTGPGSEWVLRYDQQWGTPAALGKFPAAYPGLSNYDGAPDTSRAGRYDNARVVSVKDGILDQWVRTVGGQPLVSAITADNSQTYGRYEVRFRSDTASGYKMAWLLWPVSEDWSEGEIDFPEGSLGGSIAGFSHNVQGNPADNAFAVDTKTTMGVWRTAVIEWTPGAVRFILDGKAWETTDPAAIPTTPMRWVLQTETDLSGRVPANQSAHVQIDYLRAWSYTP